MPEPNFSRIIRNRNAAFTSFSTSSNTVYRNDGTLVSNWSSNHPYQYVLPPLSRGKLNTGDYYTQGSRGMRAGFNQYGLTCDNCHSAKIGDGCNWATCHCNNDDPVMRLDNASLLVFRPLYHDALTGLASRLSRVFSSVASRSKLILQLTPPMLIADDSSQYDGPRN